MTNFSDLLELLLGLDKKAIDDLLSFVKASESEPCFNSLLLAGLVEKVQTFSNFMKTFVSNCRAFIFTKISSSD